MKFIPYHEHIKRLMAKEPWTSPEKLLKPFAEIINGPDDFRGLTIGRCIAITDKTMTKLIQRPSMEYKFSDEFILDVLRHRSMYGLECQKVTQYLPEEDKLVTQLFWSILYRPEKHVTDRPTVLNNSVDQVNNAYFDVEIELTLVEKDNLVRYATYHCQTNNVSPFSLVQNLFDHELKELDEEELSVMFPDDPDIFRIGMDDNAEAGICVPYYDKFGECFNIGYRDPEHILRHINGIRLVKCETIIEK